VDDIDYNAIGSMRPEQIGRLWDLHADRLELYARQLCNCFEDVVQEAFIDLARQSNLSEEKILPWLYRVVRNKAIGASRAMRRRKTHESEAAGSRRAWFESSPGDAIDAAAAAKALESLSQLEREIVVARIWGGLTFQQIGDLVGATDSTAHRHFESAIDAIRRKWRVSCLKKD
jgi:RNA polymerase sigma-70 factor (ECF subfamily)